MNMYNSKNMVDVNKVCFTLVQCSKCVWMSSRDNRNFFLNVSWQFIFALKHLAIFVWCV